MAQVELEMIEETEAEFVVLDSDDYAEVSGGGGPGIQMVGSAFRA